MTTIPLSRQIACAARELELRRKLYPQWIKAGRLSQSFADDEIATMAAIVDQLKALQHAQLAVTEIDP